MITLLTVEAATSGEAEGFNTSEGDEEMVAGGSKITVVVWEAIHFMDIL